MQNLRETLNYLLCRFNNLFYDENCKSLCYPEMLDDYMIEIAPYQHEGLIIRFDDNLIMTNIYYDKEDSFCISIAKGYEKHVKNSNKDVVELLNSILEEELHYVKEIERKEKNL